MFIVPDFAKYYFLTLWSRKDVDARITNKNRYHLNRKEISHARATKMAKVWKTGHKTTTCVEHADVSFDY